MQGVICARRQEQSSVSIPGRSYSGNSSTVGLHRSCKSTTDSSDSPTEAQPVFFHNLVLRHQYALGVPVLARNLLSKVLACIEAGIKTTKSPAPATRSNCCMPARPKCLIFKTLCTQTGAISIMRTTILSLSLHNYLFNIADPCPLLCHQALASPYLIPISHQ